MLLEGVNMSFFLFKLLLNYHWVVPNIFILIEQQYKKPLTSY